MRLAYWFCLAAAAFFLIWAHTHTDELPIVLGLVLIASLMLCGCFPQRAILSGAVLGAMLFVAETLVHFSFLSAPYPASAGIPWVALFGYVPAFIGGVAGVGAHRFLRGAQAD